MGANINAVSEELNKQNESLKELLKENARLNETIFGETGRDRMDKLIEATQRRNKDLEMVIEAINKDLGKSIRIETVSSDLSKLRQEIKATKEELKKLSKTDPDYQKKHQDALDKLEEQREAYDLLNDAAGKFYSAANAEQKELNKRQVEGITILDDWGESWEQRTKAIRKGAGEVSKGVSQIYQSVTKTLEPWAKANQEAMNYARSMGMSQKTADAYLSKTVSWAAKNNIGILFNKSTDELIKMQGKYSEVLGRNVQLTSEQKKDMLAMEKFLGEDGMMDIANNLENFGLGMSDSADFIHEQLSEAQKSGIAASKLTKTIRENIKMAQNYSFKNGLEGLASMAKKAVELKTDMSLVNGFIEKTSTVEGAITTGANLQVLGGSYAMGSDPLSMLYDSLNNVEGIFDRAVSMVSGKVFYNNEKGNFDLTNMDRYIAKYAATQMGIDPTKLIDVALRKASLDKIEGAARANSNIANDEDLVNLVKNLASWNEGKAVINIDGEDVDVKKIGKEHKAKLEAMQRTDTQNLQEIAVMLRSWDEIIGGEQKEISNEQANATQGIANTLYGILRNNGKLLDVTAKIGAWINIIGGTAGILGGVWTTATGVLRMGKGLGNLGRGLGHSSTTPVSGGKPMLNTKSGIFRGGRETIYTGKKGGQYRALGGGKYQNIQTGTITGSVKPIASTTRFTGAALGQSALKGLKAGGVGALIGAGLTLGTDIATGEFKRDTGSSIGRAVGPAIGSILGGVLGGPVGAMIGGFLGSTVTSAIQNVQKENRGKLRKEISSKLSESMPAVAQLFDGENALAGNYNKRQLNAIAKALEDGKIDENDDLNYWTLRKLRANNDLVKMQEQGVNVMIPMARGGYLDGKRHSEGGMPILGSNISVEGGEFVVNREATQTFRPILEQMNNGQLNVAQKEVLGNQMKAHYRSSNVETLPHILEQINVTPKEPLGNQMKVYHRSSNVETLPHNSKINIEPISINLSGTIKLDSGNKQVDISNEILNNPVLITKLTEMINKQLNIFDNSAYNKGRFKQKFV